MEKKEGNLLKLSIYLIIVIVFLVITSLFLLLLQLSNQKADGTIINVAGRQRMLSQKISKTALIISYFPDSLRQAKNKQILQSDLVKIEANFIFLQQTNNPPHIKRALDSILPKYEILATNAKRLLNAHYSDRKDFLQQILNVEPIYLPAMDRIVNLYEQEYEEKQQNFKIFIISAITVTIVVLLSIILFVIIPEIRRSIAIKAELENAVTELTRLNHTKNKFFKIIAHDLKNPFGSIMQFTSLLKENFYNFETHQVISYLDVISNQTKATYGLLNNLLDWAKLQSGEMAFNPQTIILSELFSTVEMEVSLSAKMKDIAIKFVIDEDLSFVADQIMLDTILRNLICNSIKFTNNGGQVIVHANRMTSDVLFTVSDTGIGMSQKAIDDLFRIDTHISTKGTAGELGTGLGLILCKDLVEHHEGRIWVESQMQIGSSFKFTIKQC